LRQRPLECILQSEQPGGWDTSWSPPHLQRRMSSEQQGSEFLPASLAWFVFFPYFLQDLSERWNQVVRE